MGLVWPEMCNYEATHADTDRQTDRRAHIMKLTVSFHSFVVSSKNITLIQDIKTNLQAFIHYSIMNFYFILSFIFRLKHINKSTHKVGFIFVKTLQALFRDYHAGVFLISCEQARKPSCAKRFHIQFFTKNISYTFF
jgi:hypothetical protein